MVESVGEGQGQPFADEPLLTVEMVQTGQCEETSIGQNNVIGLNSVRHEAFVSEEGVPLVPVRVIFKTREREK